MTMEEEIIEYLTELRNNETDPHKRNLLLVALEGYKDSISDDYIKFLQWKRKQKLKDRARLDALVDKTVQEMQKRWGTK